MSQSGFLQRWAQRKAQVAAESQQKTSESNQSLREASPAPSVPPVLSSQPTSGTPDATAPGAGAGLPSVPPGGVQPCAESSIDAARTSASPAAGAVPSRAEPLPALDALTPADDFSPFMQAGIDAGTRNAALRKLFSDPHFNVMDGLDIYIDDYSKPDPMPATMLRALRHARTLGLVDDEPPPGTRLDVPAAQPVADEGPQPETPVISDNTDSADDLNDSNSSASADPGRKRCDPGAEGDDCPAVDPLTAAEVVGKKPSV